jgi:D-lactate dehydrogenase (quinone)
LKSIVGRRHVLTDPERTRRYRMGFRFGSGPACAVVSPGTAMELWNVLKICTEAGKIVIAQAANTGLTGGSTPSGNDYDREVIIVRTLRISKVRVIGGGRQVVCHAGATLFQLENALKPLDREPHSIIGSSCIGASVVGGICNNSGGSLVRRGPAYTEMALFAQVDDRGELRLVNHLGICLGQTPEEILERLDRDAYSDADIDCRMDAAASSRDYARDVRDISAATPARFNADPKRLFEASGSAGKVIVFAVRLDTFPRERDTKVFYIGTNDPGELTTIRGHALAGFKELPIEGEYIHRTAFDMAEKYGKDTFLAIHYLGTGRLPALFAFKSRIDAMAARWRFLPQDLSDKLMQLVGNLFPHHLPRRMKEYRSRFQHHLLIRTAGTGIDEWRNFLATAFTSKNGDYFECSSNEGKKAFLHRFAVASAAVRYRALHRRDVEDIIALDLALPRNASDWFEILPDEIERQITAKLYYGHFFCHVFHQDYIVRKGADTSELKRRMWALLDNRGAEYPAEHNVGHLYQAKSALAEHYTNLDPCNCFNVGIGGTSKQARPPHAPDI